MTDTALTALIQANIAQRGLPFRLHVAAVDGVVTLTVRGRFAKVTDYEVTFAEATDYEVTVTPTDLVLLRELTPAVSACITRANLIQHMGGEVV